jgi:hypothetical protein
VICLEYLVSQVLDRMTADVISYFYFSEKKDKHIVLVFSMIDNLSALLFHLEYVKLVML